MAQANILILWGQEWSQLFMSTYIHALCSAPSVASISIPFEPILALRLAFANKYFECDEVSVLCLGLRRWTGFFIAV